MKKLLSIVFCAAAVTAFGNPTETQLGGEIGVTEIVSKLSNTVVAVSYDDLTGGSGIIVSNFVKTTNLDEGDQLAVFKGSGTYDTWVLAKNGEAKYWEKNKKTFTVGADGKLAVGEGDAASGVTEAVGTGIWLIRQNPTDESGNAKPFYIYGKPSTAKTITTTSEVWNLVGNPTQGDVPITAAIVRGANNDEILVPGESGLMTYLYKDGANNNQGGWLRAKDAAGNWGDPPTIKAGMGFWIKTTAEVTINWQSAGN